MSLGYLIFSYPQNLYDVLDMATNSSETPLLQISREIYPPPYAEGVAEHRLDIVINGGRINLAWEFQTGEDGSKERDYMEGKLRQIQRIMVRRKIDYRTIVDSAYSPVLD